MVAASGSATRLALLAALLLGGTAAEGPAAPPPATAERLRGHVHFLADDRLQGRDTGSAGYALAADYVARQFAAIGLRPGGDRGGWYQQVQFRRARHSTDPVLTLLTGGSRQQLAAGRDFALRPSPVDRRLALETGLVFVGHGVDSPDLGVDDYRGLDVRGRTVVALDGAGRGIAGDLAAHLDSAKPAVAARHGAAGFLEIADGPRRRSRLGSPAVVDWIDRGGAVGSMPPGLRLRGRMSPEAAGRLFAGSGRSFDEVRRELAGDRRPGGLPLAARLAVAATSRWDEFASPNVVGVLPGSDPRLRDEWVVLVAHLDHLGVKPRPKRGEDAIYNGAIDNASGVASMIEAARSLAARPPRRSILFVATAGEERGLLGADYFVTHPPVPIERIVAALDLDMPVALFDFTDVVAFGAGHSTLGATVAEAARSMDIIVSPDPMPEQTIFVRSDHYPFVRRGIPATLLFTGYANGGKEAWSEFFRSIYHSPGDDLRQPIRWQAVARYAELNARIARLLADEPQRPRWLSGSPFGRIAPRPDRPVPPAVDFGRSAP